MTTSSPARTPKSFDLVIDVTQEDIDHGVRYQCDECPIARAMLRAAQSVPLGPGEAIKRAKALTDILSLYIYGNSGDPLWAYRCKSPLEAQQFMTKFDRNIPVAPFQFTVNFKWAAE